MNGVISLLVVSGPSSFVFHSGLFLFMQFIDFGKEKDMSKKDLCEECKFDYEIRFGHTNQPFISYQKWAHCHHEPKEKQKCWCEMTEDSSPKRVKVWDGLGYVPLNFCPECGRRIGPKF